MSSIKLLHRQIVQLIDNSNVSDKELNKVLYTINKQYGGYTVKETKAIIKRENKRSKKAEKITKTSNLKCPRGQIKRSGYITKKNRVVGATCIKDMGAPGKAKKTIILKKGVLGKYGYDNLEDLNKKQRHDALKRAVKAQGYLEVIRRLTALANLNIRTNPKLSKIVRSDQKMVSKLYKESKQ